MPPTYLDAVSIGKFAESQGYGSAPRGEPSESTNEQRRNSSESGNHVPPNDEVERRGVAPTSNEAD
jgi:hypothetical protein